MKVAARESDRSELTLKPSFVQQVSHDLHGLGLAQRHQACVVLKVSRATFYACLSGPSRHEHAHADAELTGQTRVVREQSKGLLG